MPAAPRACKQWRPRAVATPATRISRARNYARRRSIRPTPSPGSSATRLRRISRARSRHECPALCVAADDGGADGAARSRPHRRHLLCLAQRHDGGGYSGAHPQQYRMGVVLRNFRRRFDSCLDRRAQCLDRVVVPSRSPRRSVCHCIRIAFSGARCPRGLCRGAVVIARAIKHRGSTLWIAALVHRLSGLALAIFLPLHFLALGLAIDGEAKLESFLRWTDQPLVKFAESGLVFLLTVHLLGGLRVLVIENLDWHDGQKQLATLAAAVSAIIAFIFLARVF